VEAFWLQLASGSWALQLVVKGQVMLEHHFLQSVLDARSFA